MVIYIAAVSEIDKEINLREIEESIENEFSFPMEILPLKIEPETFFDGKRKQYHSTGILKELLGNLPENALRVIGIVPFDLYIPILTFVFGEAQLNGKVAIVSTARLEQSFYGLPPNQPLLHRRLIKEIKHELGHTFGLLHCAQRSCVMSLATNIVDVDRKGLTFCDACTETLLEYRENIYKSHEV